MTPDPTTLTIARAAGATHITHYCRHFYLADTNVWKVYRRLDCLAGNRWHCAFIGWSDSVSWQIASSEPTDDMAIDAVRQMELFA